MTKPAQGEAVLVQRRGTVTRLTLNRPLSLNAIDEGLAATLIRELQRVAADPRCRCLTITGAGRGFCAGQSLAGGAGELPKDIGALVRSRYIPIIKSIRALPIPVVAEVNGVAAGAGFALALAADIRLASENAWFSCGFAKIGLVPDSGLSYFLPRSLGISRAFEMTATSRPISASEAYDLGLVAHVYPADSCTAEFQAFAQQLAAGPTRALALTKTALTLGLVQHLDDQLELEAQLQQEASETSDFGEGVTAFLERREPHFEGR
ncbi:MAG TPA: enoyl-CoA hydratase-related protein [Candidatus Saccharimonadales bacterium]|nr:enoyl-CoA hydratase-related protein [Candidatus Saccharimonadales bacterium]